MRILIIILINILFLMSNIIVQAKDSGVLYGWDSYFGLKWMSFGNGKVQSKYEGDIKNGKMHGVGIIEFPENGDREEGVWKDGKNWNTELKNKDGKVIGKFVSGVMTYGILFLRSTDFFHFTKKGYNNKYYMYGDNSKYMQYIGEVEDGL